MDKGLNLSDQIQNAEQRAKILLDVYKCLTNAIESMTGLDEKTENMLASWHTELESIIAPYLDDL